MVSEASRKAQSEGGRRGALRRWGGQRIVRVDDPGLSPEVRQVILQLVAAAKSGPVADSETN